MALDFSIIAHIINDPLGLFGPLLLLLVTIFAITRNTRHIQLLAFPLALMYAKTGVNIHIVILIALGVVWAITMIGTRLIGTAITNTTQAIQTAYKNTSYELSKAEKKQLAKDLRQERYQDTLQEKLWSGDNIALKRSIKAKERENIIGEATIPLMTQRGAREQEIAANILENTRHEAASARIASVRGKQELERLLRKKRMKE